MKSDVVAGMAIVATAAALFALGGVTPWWASNGNRDASFWPIVMLGLLAVLGACLALRAAAQLRTRPSSARAEQSSGRAVLRTVAVLGYVPMLFVLGFYISALLFALVLPPLLGGVRWRSSGLFAVLFTGVLYVVFTLALRMDVPDGYITLAWRHSGNQ